MKMNGRKLRTIAIWSICAAIPCSTPSTRPPMTAMSRRRKAPSRAAAAAGTMSIDSEVASFACEGATMMMTSELRMPVMNQTEMLSGFDGMPMSSAVVGRSESARSLVPIDVWLSTSFATRATMIARLTVVTVSQLTDAFPTTKARPAMIDLKGCGLLPNRMNESEMSSRSGPTVTADRVLVSASDSHWAMIQPMIALRTPPMRMPTIVPSQIGQPVLLTNQTAMKPPIIPTAAWEKLTTRTSRDMRVRQTARTA